MRLGRHRKKGSYLQAQFHRLRARRGAKKAIAAVAASILTAIFHMLTNGTLYQDLGADHFDDRGKTAKPNGSSQSSRTLATPSKSHRSQHDRDPFSF